MSIEYPSPGLNEDLLQVEHLAESHKEAIAKLETFDYGNDQGIAQLILMLLAEQSAMDLWFNAGDAKVEELHTLLSRAGLFVKKDLGRMNGMTDALFVGRTNDDRDEIFRLTTTEPIDIETESKQQEQYGLLMGFPHTALDAYLGLTPKLSTEEGEALFTEPKHLFQFVHSKAQWKDEEALRIRRCKLIKKYAPKLYERMTN